MSISEIANISRMIYSRYMKFSKNILKEKYVTSQEAECS